MRHSTYSAYHNLSIVIGIVATLVLAPALRAAAHDKVLHRFTGGIDGAAPNSLILDNAGNIYGTASSGGDPTCSNGYPNSGCGVVFELLPSGDDKWQERVLHAFHGGTDGSQPNGNLVFDASGNLYGTTSGGTDDGTVFELSPQGDGTWMETVLYRFSGGSFGQALTIDAFGNLFGVISYAESVIYELSPPQQKDGTWTETTLYTTAEFVWIGSNLVLDQKGNLYGSWYRNFCCGGVFEFRHVNKSWQLTNLYAFHGGGNGSEPVSGVILDSKGRLYGTGISGGNNWGIAFELRRSGGQWIESMLYNFCSFNNCADGATPGAPLVFDQAGTLYGTTESGGATCAERFGCGVVFKLSPTKSGQWRESVLHRFKGGLDGYGLYNGVTLDGMGNIYGTTSFGGTRSGQGFGTVFEVTP
jgi:uncharacterized repeat protein (TIGR03803 family)